MRTNKTTFPVYINKPNEIKALHDELKNINDFLLNRDRNFQRTHPKLFELYSILIDVVAEQGL